MSGVKLMVSVNEALVARPFDAVGLHRLRGEVCDVSEWRTAQQLAEMRFIIAVPPEAKVLECPCGRRWTGDIPEHPCAPRRRGPLPIKE